MTPGLLFAIGSVVFFIGGVGMVLIGLEIFDRWRIREKQDDEDTYLDDETIREAVRHPGRRPTA